MQEWQRPDSSEALLHVLLSVPASAGEEVSSWCGGLEQKIVQGAPNPHEGSQARRKRKRQENGVDQSSALKALWASPAAQLAAYRCAIPAELTSLTAHRIQFSQIDIASPCSLH
jgi:hypothetical protein